jgi:hypothetical protein
MDDSEFWRLLKERFRDLKFTGEFIAKWHMLRDHEATITWELDGAFTDEIHTRFLELADLGGRKISGSVVGFGLVSWLNALRRQSPPQDLIATAVMLSNGEFEHHEGGTVVNLIWASANLSDVLETKARQSEDLLSRALQRDPIVGSPRWTPENRPYVDTSKPANEAAEVRTRSVIPWEA